MDYLVGFLLCFCSEREAFQVFNFIVEKILPPYYFDSYFDHDDSHNSFGIQFEKFIIENRPTSYLGNSKLIKTP